ncbi:sodium-dependent organic anion transporter-like [Tachypleus tridentatus]|uniref:sodium-dependent organic anion transporter-like n=1 Tax=Tachypleus tridentatus TaxID=6853 RepID=UPI003FD474A9
MELPHNSTINFTLSNNSWNESSTKDVFLENRNQSLKNIRDGLTVFILVVIMFAMGCGITLSEIWTCLKRPFGVFIGMSCQFLLLPLVAYGLINILKLPAENAIAMLVVSCCPGGVVSNVFTFFCEGDLALSVTMTSCSTVIALGMMPFTLWVYSFALDTGDLVIPFSNIALSIVSITLPVFGGLLVKRKLSRAASICSKIGSIFGFIFVVAVVIMDQIIFPGILDSISWKLGISAVLLSTLGLIIGYTAAFLFRMAPSARRTIALECGIQNVGTAFTILSLSFPFEAQRNLTPFPMLFGFSQLGICFLLCVYFKINKRCQDHLGKATFGIEQNESPNEMSESMLMVSKP